jgi:beige protein homolog 1
MFAPTRIRPSAADTTMTSINSREFTNEVKDLLKKLSETLTAPGDLQSLPNLRFQTAELRQIRQVLIDGGVTPEAKDQFRRGGGFTILIETLQNLKGIYQVDKLSRDGRIEFFEVIKGVLDILSEGMLNHPINQRYFATAFDKGGWVALEAALVGTGMASEAFLDNPAVEDGLELLFGILLAFGLGDETTRNAFRGIRKVIDSLNLAEDYEKVETAIRKHLKSKCGESEVVQNSEIVPLLLKFWNIIHSTCMAEERPTPLLWAVPIALHIVQKGSFRNEVAFYNSHVLRPLLTMYLHGSPFPGIERLLQTLLESLYKFGVNTLDDAHQMFRSAPKSEKASGMLLHAMVASRIPAVIQFDLSLHGYSSIELSTLGKPFPPTSSSSGYSIMTWIKFDKFDTSSHTTIFGAYDKSETCFVALFVEHEDNHLVLQTSVRTPQKSSVRFRGFRFQEGVWYHIALVHKRHRTAVPARATLFINGSCVEQVKCQYPTSPPVRSSSSESFASITSTSQQQVPVHAFLGTPQALARRQGRGMVHTQWSMASFYLIQDVLAEDLVRIVHSLGPRYVGNLQDALCLFQTYRAHANINIANELSNPEDPEKSDFAKAMKAPGSLMLPESKILISFSPMGVLDNEDRNHINETRLLKSLSRDAAATLRQSVQQHGSSVIINSAIPAYNDAITSNNGMAILTGDPVVAVPNALEDACWQIGGTASVMLKLIDLAKTKDQVLRAVHILFQALEGSWRNSEVVERDEAVFYGVLTGILREKLGFGSSFVNDSAVTAVRTEVAVDPTEREELALELLRMILAFVGYSETNPNNAAMVNALAYRYLLIDFDTWRKAPIATQKLYYGQFMHYTTNAQHYRFNMRRITRMRKDRVSRLLGERLLTICLGPVKRFIEAMKGEYFSADVFPDFLEAFGAMFRHTLSPETLRMVPLFITYALQEQRALPSKVNLPKPSPTLAQGMFQNGSRPDSRQGGTRVRSDSRPSPFDPPITPSQEISRMEAGIQVLEVLTDILCEPGVDGIEIINKFARTVTNKVRKTPGRATHLSNYNQLFHHKWLLHLLAERSDPRIIVFSTKILARILVIHGSAYVKAFADRSGGFCIMKIRLREWWSIPAVWINLFAILFAVDPADIKYSEDFNQFSLSEIFAKTAGKVQHPEVMPVISALLESGLRMVVREGQQSTSNSNGHNSGTSLNVDG